jgi:hypothetical protein
LEQLLMQDVVETQGADGETRPSLRKGTAPGRVPSVTDPEPRHGRKRSSKRFNGHKGAIATDRDSQIILDAEVLPGSAPDAEGALAQVERVEENTGQRVEESQGDCAYGGAATRQAFAEAGRELVAKVPQEASNAGRFPKSAFVLNMGEETVTCPAGHTTKEFTPERDGGKIFRFGAVCEGCPLREHCTVAKAGRTLRMHPLEEELQAARAYQEREAGRRHLRERVVVEHRLARLGQLGMGQARYVGRAKTRCQLLLRATIANLRRTWNWAAGQAGNGGGAAGAGAAPGCQGGERVALGAGNELESPRWGGWRGILRLLHCLHWPVLTGAIGCSAGGFRPRF